MPAQTAALADTSTIEQTGAGSQIGNITSTAVPAQLASAASTTFTESVEPLPAAVTEIGEVAPFAKTSPFAFTTL